MPAERLQPVPDTSEELGALDLAECSSAGLRGQIGEVILGAVADLKGVVQARHFLEEACLGREMLRADVFGRWRRAALKSRGPVVLLHVGPEAFGLRGPCLRASGHGHRTAGSHQLIGLGATKLRVDPEQ